MFKDKEKPGERIRHYSTHAIVQEGEESVTIRRPLDYRSVAEQSSSTKASLSRYKYYSKLQSHSAALLNLLMPTHVVPPEFYLVIPFKPEGGKQNSIVTIFSIWNTMVGTSLLSIPWAMQQAGFGLSLGLIFLMVCLCLYTSYRVVKSVYYIDPTGDVSDFSEAANWGIHVDFNNPKNKSYVAEFHSSFPALTGILALALFIHNCLISIVRTQKNPENNVRDISIAYICVALTYVIIGAVFYLSFPLPKFCIEDVRVNLQYRLLPILS
ncbi:DgyrCDS1097 [Dimorphilus gyrociliatus]|uniref:DgyrCDS1097 n=1 Tax=Dimorphilus gyrociliatus TaxID=2664684 RepID=A0A7I8VBB8_9ANNE|nr:DgyrCDS1097 [Dimorphilus gyrociliatus]